jgi:hypothetical protein
MAMALEQTRRILSALMSFAKEYGAEQRFSVLNSFPQLSDYRLLLLVIASRAGTIRSPRT